MITRGRAARALLLSLLLAVASGASAMAAPVAAAAVAATPHAAAGRPTALVLVLDASGSMNESDGHGSTKIASARTSLRSTIAGLPADLDTGLLVFGARVPSADHAAACQDTVLTHPVGALDRPALTRAVDAVTPKGETPIGLALQRAGAALPKGQVGSIVLVSDGEDSCAPPDPCVVARQLTANGVQLTVDTIGLTVNAKAKSQLTCIAQATGGTYRDAADSAGLTAALRQATTRARRTTTGTPVQGAPIPSQAPTLTPGLWSDTVVSGETLYYGVDLADGDQATARITADGTTLGSGLYPAQAVWANDTEPSIDNVLFLGFAGSPQTRSISTGRIGTDPAHSSRRAGRYWIEIKFPNQGKRYELPVLIQLEITQGRSATATAPTATGSTPSTGASTETPSAPASSSAPTATSTATPTVTPAVTPAVTPISTSTPAGGFSVLTLVGAGFAGVVVGAGLGAGGLILARRRT